MSLESGIVQNGALITQDEWEHKINELKSLTTGNSSKSELTKAIKNAVKKRIPAERFGIMFSGGVDSGLISFLCKEMKANFICYAIGTQNSKDLPAAIDAAKIMGLALKFEELNLMQIQNLLKKASKITNSKNIVTIGVASVEIAVAELAKKDGVKILFGGLGSEEIFAGYKRHEQSEDINTECWRGLIRMRERDLVRDYSIAKAYGLTLLTPFLASEVIVSAMKFPGSEKINKNVKKWILRQVALSMGMPKSIALRPKIAAQYGSGIDKSISMLAKARGYKYKQELLNNL